MIPKLTSIFWKITCKQGHYLKKKRIRIWKPKWKKKKMMEQTIQQLMNDYKNCNICIMGIPKEEERKSRRNFWKKNGWEFSKIDDSHQITDTGEAQETPHRKNTRNSIPELIIFKLKKSKTVKLDRSPKRRKLHYLQRKRHKNCIGILFRNYGAKDTATTL